MATRAAYARYVHTVRAAYRFLRLAHAFDDASLYLPAYSDLAGRPADEILRIGVDAIKLRSGLFDPTLSEQLLETPLLRPVSFLGRDLFIPIINAEGQQWYADSSIHNFDFVVENFLGMHTGARTIYDIGAHQGIWTLYYALSVGDTGRVHSIEPSILNVECSALLLLINDITNVATIPAGIGSGNVTTGPTEDGLLVSGVRHKIRLLTMEQVFWEPADFVKIDIEGFEWDLLNSFPIFDFCRNVHLEMHIPHLERRGLDYRVVYNLIPFDRVQVRYYKGLHLTEVGKDDTFSGYCSLLITPLR